MALRHPSDCAAALTIRHAPRQRRQTGSSAAYVENGLPPNEVAPYGCDTLLAYRCPATPGLTNVMQPDALLSAARVVTAGLLDPPAVPLEEGQESGIFGAISLEESTGGHPLKTLGETNWNVSPRAQQLAIGWNTLGARIEESCIQSGVDASPLHQRAGPLGVRAPAGALDGGTRR
jgi:hypothetical protein